MIIKCPSNVHLFFVQSFDEHSNSSPSRLERPPEESPFGKISSRWWCGPKEAQRANSDFNQKSPLDAIHLDRARPGQKEGRKESSLFSIAPSKRWRRRKRRIVGRTSLDGGNKAGEKKRAESEKKVKGNGKRETRIQGGGERRKGLNQ